MNLRQTGEFEHRGTLELSPHSSQRGAVDILSGAPSTGDGRSDPRSPGECQRIERDVLWRMLTEISVSWKQAQRAQLVTFERNDAAYSAFDVLRTNVLHEMKQNGWRTVGVVSPTAGCGASLVALNLAFSLQHQPDLRTVLLDLDLAQPHLALALAAIGMQSLGDFLKGKIPAESMLRRYGHNLALGLNLRSVEYAAELLQSKAAAASLARMHESFAPDIVLCDLPPMLAGDTAAAFLSNVDCALIVARAEK